MVGEGASEEGPAGRVLQMDAGKSVRYGQVTLRIRALIGEDECLLHAATRAIE